MPSSQQQQQMQTWTSHIGLCGCLYCG